MKTINKIKVSPKGWNVTVFYDDGTKENIPFENFLRCFNDWKRAVMEYMMYIYASTRNHEIAMKAINEVKRKLQPS